MVREGGARLQTVQNKGARVGHSIEVNGGCLLSLPAAQRSKSGRDKARLLYESIAWMQFMERRFLPDKTVDVYLTDLRKLSVPFDVVNDQILECVFLEGLSIDVS